MGRIKSTLIKRTARQLVQATPELFNESFEKNKRVVGSTLSSNRVRNKVVGYICRIKKNSKSLIDSDDGSKE